MYLYNPETNDLKISNSPLEGYKEISQLRYKALLSKKADQKIKSYGKKLISIDGESGIQGRSTKIAGVSDRNSNEPTVVIDSDNGRLFGLILEVQKEAKVPTVSAGDASKLAANTEWVKLQKYVDSKTLEAYVTNSSLTAKTINVNLKSVLIMDKVVATEDWVQQQGYLKSTSLNGYATQQWVQQQGYLTSTSLKGYATQEWVQQQSYATQQWVQQQGYLTSTSLKGYATQEWVSSNYQSKLNFTPVQQGGGTGMGSNKIYIGLVNNVLKIQVDAKTPEKILLASEFNSLFSIYTQGYTHGSSVDWQMTHVDYLGFYLSCVPSFYAAGGGDQRSGFTVDDAYAISGRNSTNTTGNAYRCVVDKNLKGKEECSENPHYYLLSVGDYENVTGVVMEYVIREEGTYLKKLTKEEYLHILESFETYTDKFLYYNKEISELYEGEFPLEFKKLCSIRVKKNLLLCTDKWATKPYSNIMTESELNIFEELRALWHYEVCNDITTEVNVKNLPEFLVKKLNINLAKL